MKSIPIFCLSLLFSATQSWGTLIEKRDERHHATNPMSIDTPRESLAFEKLATKAKKEGVKMSSFIDKFYDVPNSEMAINILQPAAEKGYASAQFALGVIYRKHNNSPRARHWHLQASINQQNVSLSQECSENFRDLARKNTAESFLKDLLHKKNTRFMDESATLIASGDAGDQIHHRLCERLHHAKTLSFNQKIKHFIGLGHHFLESLHRNEREGAKNPSLKKYFFKAASEYFLSAKKIDKYIGSFFYARLLEMTDCDPVELSNPFNNMTKQEIMSANDLASRDLSIHGEEQFADIYYEIGIQLMQNNPSKARDWLESSARLGYKKAKDALPELHMLRNFRTLDIGESRSS